MKPVARALIEPINSCLRKKIRLSQKEIAPPSSKMLQNRSVRIRAIGSLVADSNSRALSVLYFNLSFFDSRIENVAAASVDETITPSNNPSSKDNGVIKLTNTPSENVDKSTPIFDRISPSESAGLILEIGV